MRTLLKRRIRAHERANRVSDVTLSPLFEPLESRWLLSTYYVSSSGSDSNSGTSTSSPWRSVSRVNSAALHAGDHVYFAGGQSFSGALYVSSSEGGTSTAPVTFGSYGSGHATIKSGGKAGLEVSQKAAVDVSNLSFTGSGETSNFTNGIFFHRSSSGQTYRAHLDHVNVNGYGGWGINFTGSNGGGYNDVRVTYSAMWNNARGGFVIGGSGHQSNSNVYLGHDASLFNDGIQGSHSVTGNGMCIFDTNVAMIERCSLHDNGKYGAAPCGAWCANSNRVTMQYNEAYNNKTATATDGGGFDFDFNTTNSVMQYNYTHNNAGPGYLMSAGPTTNFKGNTIRYNISQNDARRNGRGAIHLWGGVKYSEVYNNVVYMSSTGNSGSACLVAHCAGANGQRPTSVHIRNNIFYSAGVNVIRVESDFASGSDVYFRGNDYYSTGSFSIKWAGSTFSSLSAWRSAKHQEILNGIATGYQGNPKLAAPGLGGTIGNTDNLRSLTAYKLSSTSPVINRGVKPGSTFFSSAPSIDFYGDTALKGSTYDIGADEVA